MTDRFLITTAAIGAIVAAICCATLLLAVVPGSIGLTLAKAVYVVIPVLFLGASLLGLGLYRRHIAATCRDESAKEGDAR